MKKQLHLWDDLVPESFFVEAVLYFIIGFYLFAVKFRVFEHKVKCREVDYNAKIKKLEYEIYLIDENIGTSP